MQFSPYSSPVFVTNFRTLGPRATPPSESFKRDSGEENGEKSVDFQPINRYISETIEDRHTVILGKMVGNVFDWYSFRRPWMTLNDCNAVDSLRKLLNENRMKTQPYRQQQKDRSIAGSVDFSDVSILHKLEGWVAVKFQGHDILQLQISRKWYKTELYLYGLL